MKINKEDDDKNKKPEEKEKKDTGYIDTARMDIQCHIMIKDKDTGKILVNKRG